MSIERQIALLRRTIGEIGTWGFRRLQALERSPWTQEAADNVFAESTEYCQLEAELLQAFNDGDKRSLQISVRTYTPSHTLGAEVVATDDGNIEWDGEIHEYVNGVPRKVVI